MTANFFWIFSHVFAMNKPPNWSTHLIQWKRPAEIEYPKIWYRFETKSSGGQSYKIRIQDLPEDRFDEAIEFITRYQFTDEPICSVSKLIDEAPALEFYQQWLRQAMTQRVSIVAVIDEDSEKPPIVAMQCLFVETKDDRLLYHDAENETIKKMWNLYEILEENCNPFEVFECAFYLQDWGICTAPQFRGMGIASTILRTLTHIGQTLKLKGTFIYFTVAATQKIAIKYGFKVFSEITYNDYKNEKGEVIFPVIGTKKIQLMGKTF